MQKLKLLDRLMSIPSPTADREAVHRLLELWVHEFDAYPEMTVEAFESNGVRSALVYLGKERPERFRVLISIHLDMIAEIDRERYRLRYEGDKIIGSGVLDMKAGAAVASNLFKKLAAELPYPIAIQAVTDEEEGGFYGAKYQIEQGLRADFVLAPEPTNFEVVDRAKGIFQGYIRSKGHTAHGAYPWRGDNALEHLMDTLEKMRAAFPNPSEADNWHSSLNIASISTPNEAGNAIPETAEALFDIRFIAEDEKSVIEKVRACCDEKSELKVKIFEPAMQNPEDQPDIVRLRQAIRKVRKIEDDIDLPPSVRGANGNSDIRHFMPFGSVGVEFGPSGSEIHSSEVEWVSEHSLIVYEEILKEFLLSLPEQLPVEKSKKLV